MMTPTIQPTLPPIAGGQLVPVDARTLPLVAASLAADAGGGLARVVLEQHFHNPHAEPLSVVYSLPLPADAAVSGFAFRIGDRRIVGEIDSREAARERFEQALIEGRTAALLDEERSSLFTQELGNVPPGADVVAEITLDQRLAFIEEGAWEWRFPTTTAPRYLGSPGRVPDAARVAQEVADGPMPVRMTFSVNVRDTLDGRLPESPSHGLRASGLRLEQADAAGVPLDRDVVVRWGVTRREPGVRIETALGPANETYALVTIVPPAHAAARETVSRDVVSCST
jgi:Ca-activated chloride channel family protein